MAKAGRSLQDLAAEIQRRAEAKRDFVAPTSRLAVEVIDGSAQLAVASGDSQRFPLTALAHSQLAEYAGIPMAYYRRMQEKEPELLASSVNRWLRDLSDKRRLVRTLDGSARAILSDGYRPLENEDLADAVLPVLMEANLLILSCEITESRLYIKAVDRSIERDVPTGKAMGDGGHTIFDTCCPALTISNSEVGGGALSIESGVWTRACTNLASFGAAMRKFHTGKRADVSDDVYELLTDETKRLSDAAVWAQTRDIVRAAFDSAKFEALTQRLGGAAQDRIAPAAAVEVVERMGKRWNMPEGERKGILGALIAGGDLSRYGLHSAVTRFSQEEAVSYDRATELERLGGDVIDLQPGQWRELLPA
ncbi:MAG: hypothetical protein ABIW83_05955 [Allosphingosinicella sp.]